MSSSRFTWSKSCPHASAVWLAAPTRAVERSVVPVLHTATPTRAQSPSVSTTTAERATARLSSTATTAALPRTATPPSPRSPYPPDRQGGGGDEDDGVRTAYQRAPRVRPCREA